ncbi:unnamed protein product [Diamesa serratosioi]
MYILIQFSKSTKQFVVFEIDDTESLLEHPNYVKNKKTAVYGFGYTENFTSQSTLTIVAALIERNDHNIIVVDWGSYSSGHYITDAIPNAYKVGDIIGRKLIDMNNQGFQLYNFHLIGHSLGGQMMGFIGRSVIAYSGGTLQIQRITALDPAGPVFYPPNVIMKPLSYTDGAFVDVIHTDANFFGAPFKTGDADFWPNSGRNQPNCPKPNLDIRSVGNYCSHRRSWVYFAESLTSKNVQVFNAVQCSSWTQFVDNKCNKTSKSTIPAFMGIGANPKLNGNFYLQTNPNSPYSRNQDGGTYTRMENEDISV